MTSRLDVKTFSPTLNKKATPHKKCVSASNKENVLVGSPLLTASNGKLKGQFKIFSDGDDNIGKSGSGKKGKITKRRSLAPLQQQSVEGEDILTGRDSDSVKESFINKKNDKISEDSKDNEIKSESDSCHDDVKNLNENADIHKIDEISEKDNLVEDALALMKATENIDDSYWKCIAEERRLALEETLGENDQLYDEIDQLKEENDKMKQSLNELQCYKMLYLSLKSTLESDDDNQTKTDEDV